MFSFLRSKQYYAEQANQQLSGEKRRLQYMKRKLDIEQRALELERTKLMDTDADTDDHKVQDHLKRSIQRRMELSRVNREIEVIGRQQFELQMSAVDETKRQAMTSYRQAVAVTSKQLTRVMHDREQLEENQEMRERMNDALNGDEEVSFDRQLELELESWKSTQGKRRSRELERITADAMKATMASSLASHLER